MFAEIIEVQRFRKVVYYTVSINDEQPLFIKFKEAQTIQNKEKLHHIMAWIQQIGNKIGAYEQYFRNEAESADTRAIPPKGKDRKPCYLEFNEQTETEQNTPNDLRLYCYKANEHVVFLFDGDVKTKDKAQDCPNVRNHFKLANKLSGLLEAAYRNKNISWNEDYTDIIVDEDFQLEW